RALGEHLDDHDRIRIDPVDHAPRMAAVAHTQLVAGSSDRGHRSGQRHRELLSTLESPQQHPRFDSRLRADRRGLQAVFEPDERLVFVGQTPTLYANYDILHGPTTATGAVRTTFDF